MAKGRILVEDLPFEDAKFGRDLEAELFAEHRPVVLEHAQGFGVTSASIERRHQEGKWAFTKGILGEQSFEIGHNLAGRTNGKSSRGELLQRDQTLFFQASRVDLRPGLVGKLEQRPAAPQTQPLGQQRDRELLFSICERRATVCQRDLELSAVDHVSVGDEHIAG